MTKRFKVMNNEQHRASMQGDLYSSVSKAHLNKWHFTTKKCSCHKECQADS